MSRLFDANGERISLGNNAPLNNLEGKTFTAWVYVLTQVAEGHFMSSTSSTTNTDQHYLIGQTGSDGKIEVYADTSPIQNRRSSAGDLPINSWRFIACTLPAPGVLPRIFIGQPGGSVIEATYTLNDAGGGARPTNAGVWIGERNDGTAFVPAQARLAEVKLWPILITNLNELTSIMYGKHLRQLDGWWSLGIGSTEPDWSGNINNGTLAGGSTIADHPPIQSHFHQILWMPSAAAAITITTDMWHPRIEKQYPFKKEVVAY